MLVHHGEVTKAGLVLLLGEVTHSLLRFPATACLGVTGTSWIGLLFCAVQNYQHLQTLQTSMCVTGLHTMPRDALSIIAAKYTVAHDSSEGHSLLS